MKEITRDQAKACMPLKDHVLVQVEKMAGVTFGGLYLPDALKKRVAYGRVVAIGPGYRTAPKKKGKRSILVPLDVAPGDIVLLPKWRDPQQGELQDEQFLIGRQSELLAIVASGTRVSIK